MSILVELAGGGHPDFIVSKFLKLSARSVALTHLTSMPTDGSQARWLKETGHKDTDAKSEGIKRRKDPYKSSKYD